MTVKYKFIQSHVLLSPSTPPNTNFFFIFPSHVQIISVIKYKSRYPVVIGGNPSYSILYISYFMFHSDFIPHNNAYPGITRSITSYFLLYLCLWRLLPSGFLVGRNEMNAAASLWKPPSEGCARGKADNRHRYFLLQTGKNKMAVLSYSPQSVYTPV